MEPIRNILVCLDSTRTDEDLLTYTKFILQNSPSAEKVTAINVLKDFDFPSEVLKQFPNLKEEMLTEREEELQKEIDKHIGPVDQEIEVLVTPGSGMKTLLEAIDSKDIQLILMGRKTDGTGEGVITFRMSRRCPITLFIVPTFSAAKIEHTLTKILVPIDFSDYSKLAVDRAIRISENYPNVEIICQHVYSVPSGYHYSGKSQDQFGDIMKSHAEKQFRSFIKRIDTKDQIVKDVYTLDNNENVVEDIYFYAKKIDADAIIFGSKGMTPTSSLFLGSTAEKLIRLNSEFPLMVVRQPGDVKGIMEIFKQI